jgi:MerR family copper efflux transcriptional regulator
MKTKSGSESFTIGQIAVRASVNTQTLRYYERSGVLSPTSRTVAGYRTYDVDSLRKLKFIKEAQELGFSLTEIKELLGFRISSTQQCGKVRSKAEIKLQTVRDKIKQLRGLERTLKKLMTTCDQRRLSDRCPIIEKMERV